MHIFSIRTPISGEPHYWNAAVDRDVKIFPHAPAANPEVESMGRSYDLKIPQAPNPCPYPQWLLYGSHFEVSPKGKNDNAVDCVGGETVMTEVVRSQWSCLKRKL